MLSAFLIRNGSNLSCQTIFRACDYVKHWRASPSPQDIPFFLNTYPELRMKAKRIDRLAQGTCV